MSDYANVLSYLEECKRLYKSEFFLKKYLNILEFDEGLGRTASFDGDGLGLGSVCPFKKKGWLGLSVPTF